MKHQDELLNKAIEAVRDDEPGSEAIHASAARISDRLGVAMRTDSAVEQIRGCEDVRRLLPSYREGTLPEARALLVKAHLGDCGTCLRYFREGSKAATVDWSVPARTGGAAAPAHSRPGRPERWDGRSPSRSPWRYASRFSTRRIGKCRPACAPRCSRSTASA